MLTTSNANAEWSIPQNATPGAGVITVSKAAEAGNQHILRFIRAKSDKAASVVTVKSGSTTLATFDLGAAEKVFAVYVPANRSEALEVSVDVTTAGALAASGETKA